MHPRGPCRDGPRTGRAGRTGRCPGPCAVRRAHGCRARPWPVQCHRTGPAGAVTLPGGGVCRCGGHGRAGPARPPHTPRTPPHSPERRGPCAGACGGSGRCRAGGRPVPADLDAGGGDHALRGAGGRAGPGEGLRPPPAHQVRPRQVRKTGGGAAAARRTAAAAAAGVPAGLREAAGWLSYQVGTAAGRAVRQAVLPLSCSRGLPGAGRDGAGRGGRGGAEATGGARPAGGCARPVPAGDVRGACRRRCSTAGCSTPAGPGAGTRAAAARLPGPARRRARRPPAAAGPRGRERGAPGANADGRTGFIRSARRCPRRFVSPIGRRPGRPPPRNAPARTPGTPRPGRGQWRGR